MGAKAERLNKAVIGCGSRCNVQPHPPSRHGDRGEQQPDQGS